MEDYTSPSIVNFDGSEVQPQSSTAIILVMVAFVYVLYGFWDSVPCPSYSTCQTVYMT